MRQAEEGVLGDIQEGSVVKDLTKPGGFLSVPEHAALMLNTDGVQLFNSSKHSMWPVYLIMCNLPPQIRINEKFQILAGAWCGPKKPLDMSLLLKPVVNKLHNLLYSGIEADTPSGKKLVKAVVLTGNFDLPAKVEVLNIKQFNGKNGCLYCEDPGEILTRGQRIYPPGAPHQARTEREIKRCGSEAEAKGEAVLGIKGHSILNGVVNIPFDYMHCILEGVVKSLMTYWFDSKHHSQSYNMRPWIEEVNKMLTRIKPPHDFRRSPRSIDTVKFWKASEYRAFILFYALPILKAPRYVHHLSRLVLSLHVMLSDSLNIYCIKFMMSNYFL